ncbi:hypothetical protein ACFX2G_034940 [Malus domestica]
MDEGIECIDPLRGGDDATGGRNLNTFRPRLAVNDHHVDLMLPEAPMVGAKLDNEACLAGRKWCTMDGHLENLQQPYRKLRQAESPSGVLVGQRGRMSLASKLSRNFRSHGG